MIDQEKPSVLVGMSGGVDSSVTAALLQQQGYVVTGCTMHLFGSRVEEGNCGGMQDISDAELVCQKLGLPHITLDCAEAFRREVMDYFAQSYLHGETPNPCIMCNRRLKFGEMLDFARSQHIGAVATGHYARIDHSGSRILLKRAGDVRKDQTYFLYGLTQHQLAHTLMPLGELTKQEVRTLAEDFGLLNARKRDSQDICFIPDGDYGSFIESFTGMDCPAGNYIDCNGQILGTHKGHIRYTLGQRKGLNISLGERAYVIAKDTQRNTVTLGRNEELFSSSLDARSLNLIALDRIEGELRCTAKIRHSQNDCPATVIQTGEDRILVRFDQPQRAITAGQAVVLYDGDVVLGGGTISNS